MAITSNKITRPFRADQTDVDFHLTSNLAQVLVGEQVVGLLQKLSISEELGATPIYEVGSPIFADVALGAIKVSLDGTLIMSPSMPLWDGDFLPRTPYELMHQSVKGITFDIKIKHRRVADNATGARDALEASDDAKEQFMIIKHCRYQSSSINIQPNKPIDTGFKAIGLWVEHTNIPLN